METNDAHFQSFFARNAGTDDTEDCTCKQQYEASYPSKIPSVLGAILLRQVGAR